MARSVRTIVMTVVGVTTLSIWLQAAGPTPIADAAKARDREAVRKLLRQGGDVNAAHGDGMTALHWAATQDDSELAGMLLAAGANVRARTRLGRYTPLHVAAQAGAGAALQRLLDAGADVNAATSSGTTPLMLAAASGDATLVTRLLDKGAEPNAKETTHGQTALMFAAARDRAEVTRVLLARGADASVASTFVDLLALAGLDSEGRRVQAAQEPAPAPPPFPATLARSTCWPRCTKPAWGCRRTCGWHVTGTASPPAPSPLPRNGRGDGAHADELSLGTATARCPHCFDWRSRHAPDF